MTNVPAPSRPEQAPHPILLRWRRENALPIRVYSLEVGQPAQAKPAQPAPERREPPRLSLVVLPFVNIGGDPDQEYFADGITDDLTTDLSHLPDSFVISRGTAFTYKGKPVDAKQIGRELGVCYVLEGSVRRVGETITVNAQLISAETRAHVWADQFEGERRRLGQLHVEFVSRLANSLGVELIKSEALRAERERPDNPDAVDLAMQGWAKLNGSASKAALDAAAVLFERALSLDANNVRAMIGLAGALTWRVNQFWSADPGGDIARAEKAIDAALALQPGNSSAHGWKSRLLYAKRQWGPAIAEAETAIALDHNNAGAHADAGFFKVFLGRSEDGVVKVTPICRCVARYAYPQSTIYAARARHSANATERLCLYTWRVTRCRS